MARSRVHKYLYKEPKGIMLQDTESPKAKEGQIENMKKCLLSSTAMAQFRIGRHTEGQFKGLFTLEVMEKGKWLPVCDGDLLLQVVDDIKRHIDNAVEAYGK